MVYFGIGIGIDGYGAGIVERIVVTNKVASLQSGDKAARLQSGSMVKSGIAAELLENCCTYSKLAPEYKTMGKPRHGSNLEV